MKTLHLIIVGIVFITGTGIIFSHQTNAQMQNVTSPTYFSCMANMTQNMKVKYASFDEERAKAESINYGKFKSEVNGDKYTFRAVSQEWINDQVKCDATLKDVLVLFFVNDTTGKQRDVTVIVNPETYRPQGISVERDPPTHGGVITMTLSPLKQFKSGVNAQDVKCKQDLQLVIKTEDGSPACVNLDTAIVLVEHGWATNVPQPNPMVGLNKDTGIATLGNQAYYFETANYTNDTYYHPVPISFHDVTFTLFPSGFRGGLPAWGCGGGYYWANAKFSDGTHELLQIFVGSKDCHLPQPSTHFSNHTNPQAGLTFYDGKMKLLVSANH